MAAAPCHSSPSVQLVEIHKWNILGILAKLSSSCQHVKHSFSGFLEKKTLHFLQFCNFSSSLSLMHCCLTITVEHLSFYNGPTESTVTVTWVIWLRDEGFKLLSSKQVTVNVFPQILTQGQVKLHTCKSYRLNHVKQFMMDCGLWSIEMPHPMLSNVRGGGTMDNDTLMYVCHKRRTAIWTFWGSSRISTEKERNEFPA